MSSIPRLALLGLLALGCVSKTSEIAQPVEGNSAVSLYASLARLDYHVGEGAQACADAPERAERILALVEGYLGAPGPEKIDYILAPGSAWPDGYSCPDRASGCSRGLLVVSRENVHRHELVHAALTNEGRAIALLREGLATALGYDGVSLPESIPSLQPLIEGVTDPAAMADPSVVYSSGAVFAAHLLRQFGGEQFMDLYRALDDDMSYEAVAAAFSTTLGGDIESAWKAAHHAAAPYVCIGLDDDIEARLVSDAPNSGPEERSPSARDSCDGEDPANRRVWTLEEETGLAVATNHYTAQLASCDDGGLQQMLYGSEDGAPQLYLSSAPAGQYMLHRRAEGRLQASDEHVDVQRGAFVSESCREPMVPYPLDSAPELLRLRLREAERIALRVASTEGLTYVPFEGAMDEQLVVCRDCELTEECSVVRGGQAVELPPGASFVGSLQGKSTGGGKNHHQDHDEDSSNDRQALVLGLARSF